MSPVRTAAVMGLAALLATSARADTLIAPPEFAAGMRSAALQLGLARPTANGGFQDFVGAGPAAGLQGFYYLWDWAAIGAELDYVLLGKKTSVVPSRPLVSRTGTASGVSLTGLGRVNLLRGLRWTPFIVGGAGLHSLQLKVTAASNDPTGAPCLVGTATCAQAFGSTAKGKGLTVTAGGGIEVFLFRGMSLALEARWRRYEDAKALGDGVETLGYLLGTRVYFGLP